MSQQQLSALDWACRVTAEPLQSKIVTGEKALQSATAKACQLKTTAAAEQHSVAHPQSFKLALKARLLKFPLPHIVRGSRFAGDHEVLVSSIPGIGDTAGTASFAFQCSTCKNP